MYVYEDLKSKIFTEEGQAMFLKIRDNVKNLIDKAGVVTMGRATSGTTGDSWTMMACVDRLVELGEIIEVEQVKTPMGQYRIFRTKS